MKVKKTKIIGIITIVMMVTLLMSGCNLIFDNDDNNENGSGNSGNGGGGNGGGTVTNQSIIIRNNTGFSISGVWIKPSTATSWGSNLWTLSGSLSDGQSRTFTLSQSLSAESVYDIQLSTTRSLTGTASRFIKYGVTVSEGMILPFTISDLDDLSNLPTITIQNRSGVNFNSVFIKPSVSSDWGGSFGSISNNSNSSETIPIPPSNYTVFDIQARSTNPANTYTKSNVTISNGMIITYTSADSDNALLGNPVIVIQNNTGFSISGVWIKPSTATSWGSNLWTLSGSLSDGQSRTFTLSQSLSAESVYDIQLSTTRSLTGAASRFIKYGVTVSEGMIITFDTGDLE